MNSIQRVSVDTHKTMNFTLTKNRNRYDVNYTVTNAKANKMLRKRIQYLRYDLTFLTKHLHTLRNIMLH
jgi:hypothetical protein